MTGSRTATEQQCQPGLQNPVFPIHSRQPSAILLSPRKQIFSQPQHQTQRAATEFCSTQRFLARSSELHARDCLPLREHSRPSRAAFPASADSTLPAALLADPGSTRRGGPLPGARRRALRAWPKDGVKSHFCAGCPQSP